MNVVRHRKAALQDAGALSRQIEGLASGKQGGQIMGKGVLQADTELIQFHRHNTDQGTGEKAF